MRRDICRCSWGIALRRGGRPRFEPAFLKLLLMSNGDSVNRILHYYGEANEESRLETGWFKLEHARTQELILRHLPGVPATVIDAGGGAGVYACWLAGLGYRVHLIDVVPKHVEQARAKSAQQAEHPL